MFATLTSEGLVSRLHFSKSYNQEKKMKNPIEKWAKSWSRHFTHNEETKKWPIYTHLHNQGEANLSHSEIPLHIHYIGKLRNQTIPRVGRDVKQHELLLYHNDGKQFDTSRTEETHKCPLFPHPFTHPLIHQSYLIMILLEQWISKGDPQARSI